MLVYREWRPLMKISLIILFHACLQKLRNNDYNNVSEIVY